MITAGILLAAGGSTRFEAGDKLLAPFQGAPLVTHAAAALRALAPELLIAVTASKGVAELLPRFTQIAPRPGQTMQSASLRYGIAAAARSGADRALIVLGDMPFIDAETLRRVVASCSPTMASATTNGCRRTPPACFPSVLFPSLLDVRGDMGAKALLAQLPDTNLVPVAPDMLPDIDTLADLRRLESLVV